VADAVSEQQPAARPMEAELPARRRADASVPRHRFGIAYLILAAALGAAVGLFVVLVSDGGRDGGAQWSAWKPTEDGVQRLDEISKYVSRGYALPSGRRLVGILSTPPVVQGSQQTVPVRAIAVRTGLRGETSDDASIYEAGSAWAYILCGLGQNCAIPEGKASVARGQLLRREALELALYTFKYQDTIQSVLAFMPPAKGQQPKAAVFLRRADLDPALKVPLARTLPPRLTTIRPGQMSASELGTVRRYTDQRAYNFEYQQLPDGTAVVVLEPLAA
jgi:hypothetical protein